MAETPQYELIAWGDDNAPDAENLYPMTERRMFKSLVEAQRYANYHAGEEGMYTGAAVYLKGVKVYGVGLTHPYPYKPENIEVCPMCQGKTGIDHNSYWCDRCQMLWPRKESSWWYEVPAKVL